MVAIKWYLSSVGPTPGLDQPRSEMSSLYLVLGQRLGRFPVDGAAGLASPIFSGTFGTHGRAKAAGISSIGKVARHSEPYKFRSRAFCREVSSRELFKKIPSLPLALGRVFSQSLPKIHDHR